MSPSPRSRSAGARLVAAVLLSLALSGAPGTGATAPPIIAVVLSRDLPAYREALRGFEEILAGAGVKYKLHEFTDDGAGAAPGALVERVRAKRPTLVFTVGSAATNRASAEISDVPIVFSMVLSSAGNRSLQELRRAHPNLTGATMEIPLQVQFTKLKELLPGVRRIGVLYNPEVSGPLVEQAAATVRELDLDLVALPVTSEADVLERAGTLAGSVDALWSVADGTVFSEQGLRRILLETLRNRIPFIGLSPAIVKAGALLSFSTDYRDLGRQAGEQSLKILSGADTAQIPTAVPRNLQLTINLNTARQIQVQIPDEVRLRAELFF